MSDEQRHDNEDNAGQDQQREQGAGSSPAPETPTGCASWLASQPEETRDVIAELHEAEVVGIRTAPQSEKDTRRKLREQLDAAIERANGSEETAALEKVHKQLGATNERAGFDADAHAAGFIDLRAAWEYEPNDRKGKPDLDALAERCPYLRTQAAPPPTPQAGAGSASKPSQGGSFDDNLRRQVSGGRGS